MKGNKPSRKKVAFSVSKTLQTYLEKYGRITDLPIQYEDMGRYFTAAPLLDLHGKDTLWETVYYHEAEKDEIDRALCKIYAILKTDGDIAVIEHLQISRIDYCTFGNTKPYRVRIMNKLNDNYDHFYVKKIDSSRVYGLELEHVLSPNRVTYLIDGETLIEEHIAGIPGDFFLENNLDVSEFNQIRIAKEFVKFTERCFVQLLGDMRSYNYIIDITPDIEGNQYRIRAIDFDQQSYEGRKKFYMPQYFKENNPIIELGLKYLTPESVKQYQLEERSLIARRARTSSTRLNRLLRVMKKDTISEEKKINQLREDLRRHHKADEFRVCKNMGEIVYKNIELVLQKEFKQSILDV